MHLATTVFIGITLGLNCWVFLADSAPAKKSVIAKNYQRFEDNRRLQTLHAVNKRETRVSSQDDQNQRSERLVKRYLDWGKSHPGITSTSKGAVPVNPNFRPNDGRARVNGKENQFDPTLFARRLKVEETQKLLDMHVIGR